MPEALNDVIDGKIGKENAFVAGSLLLYLKLSSRVGFNCTRSPTMNILMTYFVLKAM